MLFTSTAATYAANAYWSAPGGTHARLCTKLRPQPLVATYGNLLKYCSNSHVTGRDTARPNVPPTYAAAARAVNAYPYCSRRSTRMSTSGYQRSTPIPHTGHEHPHALGLTLMTCAPATIAATQCGPPLARNIPAPSPTSNKERRASHARKRRTSAHATLGCGSRAGTITGQSQA